MKYISTIILLSLSFIVAARSNLNATCNRPWKTPLTKIKGTIEESYDAVPKMKGNEGLHLKVTDQKTGKLFTIHVFPTKCTKNNPRPFEDLRIGIGDDLIVHGSKFTTGKTTLNICAAEISSHGFTQKEKGLLRNLTTGSMNKIFCKKNKKTKSCKKRCKNSRNRKRCMKRCTSKNPGGGGGISSQRRRQRFL
jgi:hypothetical protein